MLPARRPLRFLTQRGPAAALLVGTLALPWLAACDVRIRDGQVSVDVAGSRADDVWRRTYTLPKGATIEVANANGAVRVEASRGATVEVEAERRAQASSPEAAKAVLDGIRIIESPSSDRVRISTDVPNNLLLADAEVRFVVKVPAGIRVEAGTANGGIELEDLAGEVVVSTTNGGIRGTVGALSRLEARTTNGGIRLTLRERPAAGAALTLASVNGGVRLTVPTEFTADLTASCVTGRVEMDGLRVEGTSQPRRVEGRVNGGGGATVALSTTNGGIRIGTTPLAATDKP